MGGAGAKHWALGLDIVQEDRTVGTGSWELGWWWVKLVGVLFCFDSTAWIQVVGVLGVSWADVG